MTAEGGASVGVVLLAAGRGTRFLGAPKLLAPFRGKPLLRHAAEAALGSNQRPVVAVVGHEAGAVRAALAGLDLAVIENPDFAAGLSTSLKAGLAALPPRTAGAIVMLGDMPGVAPMLIDALAAAFRADPEAAAIVPTWAGRRGNPVLLNRCRLAAELAALVGDQGAGPILKGRGDVRELAVDDAGIVVDVDTREALAALDP